MAEHAATEPVIRFTITQEKNRVTAVSTNSSVVNHFLDLIKLSCAYNTWVSYAYDLKLFFEVIPKLPEAITRSDCLVFMQHQAAAGCPACPIPQLAAAHRAGAGCPLHPRRNQSQTRNRTQPAAAKYKKAVQNGQPCQLQFHPAAIISAETT